MLLQSSEIVIHDVKCVFYWRCVFVIFFFFASSSSDSSVLRLQCHQCKEMLLHSQHDFAFISLELYLLSFILLLSFDASVLLKTPQQNVCQTIPSNRRAYYYVCIVKIDNIGLCLIYCRTVATATQKYTYIYICRIANIASPSSTLTTKRKITFGFCHFKHH